MSVLMLCISITKQDCDFQEIQAGQGTAVLSAVWNIDE